MSWIDSIGKPIIALSPMADMTDSPFCLIAKLYGNAPVVFREMVSSEAVVRGNEKTLGMTAFDPRERPIVQQIFGSDPETMARAAETIVTQHKVDGIDLNMGCPVYKITHNFNGAALMKEPDRAQAIVRAIKRVVSVPVTVKIRLGWSNPTEALDFAPRLEEAGADLLTIHGRTKAQGYSGTSDWAQIGEVVKRVNIPVLANGDINTAQRVAEALRITNAAGVLIARGALGNPWIFAQIAELLHEGNIKTSPTATDRFAVMVHHLNLMSDHYGDHAAVLFRKHLSWYTKAIPDSKEFRMKAMELKSTQELIQYIKSCKL